MCNQYNKELKEYERMPCDGCGFRQKIFSGASTKEDFCKWLFTKTHKGFTVIAHNARGYDAYFLYDYLMMNGSRPDPVIFSGSKIMYMHINSLNMRLLDSLNFLPMPLANLPKSFGLKEKKKGFSHISSIQKKINTKCYLVYQTWNTMILIACQKKEEQNF